MTIIKNPYFQATVFVVVTFVVSWTQQYFIITGDGIQNTARPFVHMWTPGLVGIFCAIIFEKKIKSIALKVPSFKSLAIAYFVPAVIAALIIGLLVLAQQAEFQVSPKLIESKGSLGAALFAALVVAPTMNMIVSFISGLGEEIGWRGFLHSKLMSLKPSFRYLLTGIIWSIWHWPLIIFGDYSTSDKPWLNVAFFTVALTSLSFLMGWLRDTSNSCIPAGLLHGSHNIWILGISPAFILAGPLVPYFGGESGLYCAILYAGLAAFIHLKISKRSVAAKGVSV